MKSESMNLKEVATEDLVAMLRHVSVETGSLTCLGCGHEHNCGTRGCALIREAADRLAEYLVEHLPTITPPNDPLTQDELDKMDYDKVWIDYEDDCGEWALVCDGHIYSIDTLEGAGLDFAEYMHGERLEPNGYKVYRRPPERQEDNNETD